MPRTDSFPADRRPPDAHLQARQGVLPAAFATALIVGAMLAPPAAMASDPPAGGLDPEEIAELQRLIAAFAHDPAMDGTSRLVHIGSCAELTEALAPVLTPAHVLVHDSVEDFGYPNPAPYQIDCTWSDPDTDADIDRIVLSANATSWDQTRDDLRAAHPHADEFAGHVSADAPYRNVMLFKPHGNYPLFGTYLLVLAAPSNGNDVMAAQVMLSYHFGDGNDEQPYNVATLESIERARAVPGDDAVVEALLGLLEPTPGH